MTPSELEAILGRLETLAPSSRLSEKRQLLSGSRERILALRKRGHSWRSLANELSTAVGQKISPDLLRAACVKRTLRHNIGRATTPTPASNLPKKEVTTVPTPAPTLQNSDRFGAKGLKL